MVCTGGLVWYLVGVDANRPRGCCLVIGIRCDEDKDAHTKGGGVLGRWAMGRYAMVVMLDG